MRITHFNSPTIFDGQIGVYDYRWGNTAGYRAVDEQREDVRQVVIRDNTSSRTADPDDREQIRGLVLVGRGTGANALNALKQGDNARIDVVRCGAAPRSPSPATRCCCSAAYAGWSTTSRCTRVPRSASTRRRQGADPRGRRPPGVSRGLTMVELANLMSPRRR